MSVTAIPPALIYKMWQGKPIYYKGCLHVLAGKKSIEEIVFSTDLQGVLISLVLGASGSSINRKKYLLAT